MPHLRSCAALCLLASLLAFSSTASAQPKQPELLTALTTDRIAAILKDAGYRAEIAAGTSTPRVRTGIGGYNVIIDLYGCEQQRCASMQFYAGFKKAPKFTLQWVNAWNQAKRYAKAYLNKDEELSFEFDVLVEGGVTPAFIKEQVALFERLLGELDKFEPKP